MTRNVTGSDGTHWIFVDDETYTEFVDLINAPMPDTPKLDRLFATPTPWEDEEGTG